MKKKNRPRANKRFNRYEFRGEHRYVTEFEASYGDDVQYQALIKCKLVHGLGYSVVLPELLILTGGNPAYIQPFFFYANVLWKDEAGSITCSVPVDISHGCRLWVEFRNDQFIRKLDDGSEIFHCVIKGPPKLNKYTTGRARIRENYDIEIGLYHHTTQAATQGISDSGYYWASNWNIQGTKKMENVGYVYFTPLDAISADADLYQIAMSSQGEIHLRRDNARSYSPEDVLEMKVYRQTTADRRHTICLWLGIDLLATQYVYRHAPYGQPVHYQIVSPFIHRVGLHPSCVLEFQDDHAIKESQNLKYFEYVVIGDADSLDGLKAPYDEENTQHVWKIERCEGTNILDFWMDNTNQDHFSKKAPEYRRFQRDA